VEQAAQQDQELAPRLIAVAVAAVLADQFLRAVDQQAAQQVVILAMPESAPLEVHLLGAVAVAAVVSSAAARLAAAPPASPADRDMRIVKADQVALPVLLVAPEVTDPAGVAAVVAPALMPMVRLEVAEVVALSILLH
jgi:hypothetical protein